MLVIEEMQQQNPYLQMDGGQQHQLGEPALMVDELGRVVEAGGDCVVAF